MPRRRPPQSHASEEGRDGLRTAAISRALGLPLDAIEAAPWQLRRRLEKLSVSEVGMPARKWRTVLTNLDAALQIVGLGAIPRRSLIQLSANWDALMQRVVDRYDRSKLSRFFSYCQARNIGPEAVDNAAMQAFGKSLVEESLVGRATQVHRDAVLTWNRCVEAVKGWPQTMLTVPCYSRRLFFSVTPRCGRTLRAILHTMGSHKTPAQVSAQVPKAIREACGFEMNCHLFRHFAALIYLMHHRGDYPAVQKMLGHKSIQTTMASYCWVERSEVLERWETSLAELRKEHGA